MATIGNAPLSADFPAARPPPLFRPALLLLAVVGLVIISSRPSRPCYASKHRQGPNCHINIFSPALLHKLNSSRASVAFARRRALLSSFRTYLR